jgi:Flp pilus assembly protein TadD
LWPVLLPAQGVPRSSPVGADLEQGETALRAKDEAAAKSYFEDALKHEPNNPEAHANLGAIAFFHGDCASAEPHLRQALRVKPDLDKVEALLSVCERRQGEASGQADMEHAFAALKDPKLRLQIGIELANGYYQQGELEKTSAVLQRLLASNPEDVDILFFAQRVYSELADMTLNKLAVLSPGSARMEQLIAERLINAGDLKDAITHYRKALELGPKLPGLHFELAEALLEGDANEAAAQTEARIELEAAIQVEGDTAKVECELGRISFLQSNNAEAMSHYQRAYGEDPGNVQAQIGLADVYRRDGNTAEAAKYLRMAVKQDPLNPEPHYKLAQVDRQLHDDEEEKKELQLFLDLRTTRDKVKTLYREMNPQTAGEKPSDSVGVH